jgi:ribosomal-protein-alanine N-acetyltransferase
MQTLSVRDMQVADLPAVIAIEKASFTSPWSEESVLSEIYSSQSLTRVAIENQNIVGYYIAKLVIDEGQLLDIAVKPECRQQGIADLLMGDLLSGLRLKRVVKLFLEVRATNAAAINLYRKYGFASISTRKNYYKNPVEDAYIMMVELK